MGDNQENPALLYDHPTSQGMETVEVPPPPGWSMREKVTFRDLPHHVNRQVAGAASRGQGHVVLGHYTGLCEGAGLLDAPTLDKFKNLARGLAAAQDQAAYVRKNVTPLLESMKAVPRAK